MKTEIGRIQLRLPAGLERRSRRIGRLVGEALARCDLPAGRVDQLAVGPVTVDVRRSDHAIADHIAGNIHAAIGRQTRTS
jgi:hypothetical protein